MIHRRLALLPPAWSSRCGVRLLSAFLVILRSMSKGPGRTSEDVNHLYSVSRQHPKYFRFCNTSPPSRIEHVRVKRDMFSQVHVLRLCRTRRVLCVVTRCYSWLTIFTFHGEEGKDPSVVGKQICINSQFRAVYDTGQIPFLHPSADAGISIVPSWVYSFFFTSPSSLLPEKRR